MNLAMRFPFGVLECAPWLKTHRSVSIAYMGCTWFMMDFTFGLSFFGLLEFQQCVHHMDDKERQLLFYVRHEPVASTHAVSTIQTAGP